MITFLRIVQVGMRNFLRNVWLSTAATAVMTVTLAIVLFSFISNTILGSSIQSIVNKIDISVYLVDSTTQQQVKDLQSNLARMENVESVRYVSKSDALKKYQEQNKGNKNLLSVVSEADNPLPQSLEIKAKDPAKMQSIADYLNRPELKPILDPEAPISYSADRKVTVDRIVSVSNFLKKFGLIMSLVFVVISVLIIFNTIRMAIFTRREEIEIMKLVGATSWFIRGPFIVEAALYGVIAAIIAVSLCYSVLLTGGPKLASYIDIGSSIAFFSHYPVPIFLAELGIGVLIGALSSLLAMTRYLKL